MVAQELLQGPRRGIRGPFAALLRNPRLADRVRQLGDSIRFENSLPPMLREFAILIVARFWAARYEWHAHGKLAVELGVAQSTVDAIGEGRDPQGLSADETLVYRFCTELLHDKDVGDATYDEAVVRFGEVSVLDLLATMGYFGFVSLILNATRHPVPEGGTELPRLMASAGR
ncbi:carboxymuconolactone decarboxylase family protein [Variovorax sp. J22R115]|uniref:carboxymuconolactone decarboxylase family protein n=1 Tax=Variovorax sp. J22R115 TaxID=3053509 RepID=UPI00257722E9|nr:carboxymuconolactone decarboxylase family protein [Variovorax sp. J22R115]MDM0053585.1 carboxymuconolactone decarboxylase family protein [Variovorax sp. J22R115]